MLFEITMKQFTKMLHNLSLVLDKGQEFAESKKIDVEVLLNSRLAPDQFNLIRQVQIACDTAKLAAARLAGKEAPVHEDFEKTLPELKARIKKVVGYLNDFSANDFKDASNRKVTPTPRWEGKYLNGVEYLTEHAIPNLYFH
ncbi:MAG: DUF1993 domain-containing protein [Bacteriovoracaceae bacterium]